VVAWVIKRYRVLVFTDISEHSASPVLRFQNFYSNFESSRFFKNYTQSPCLIADIAADEVGVVGAFKILNESWVVREVFNVNQQVEGERKGQNEIVARPENYLLELKRKK
jgi:hypothetical protein